MRTLIAELGAGIRKRLTDAFRQRDGRLTRELLLRPGGFGLGMLPEGMRPTATTDSVCGYCSTGCSLTLHLKDGEAMGLTPNPDYPVNLGLACPKGWEALRVLESPERATVPLLRNGLGQPVETTWETALETFCHRFKSIQERHGKDAVAFISTGQIPTEEMTLLGCLAKFGMGLIHGDGNTRQCMATAVRAYKESFGFDAPPYTYRDFEESDVLVFVGSNLCIAHPILWERVLKNPNHPEIVVIDPRKTETAMQASLHLPILPKSDLVLFYGLAHILVKEGLIDQAFIRDHTEEFEAFRTFVEAFPPLLVAQATGVEEEQLYHLARLIGRGKRVSFWWTMGVNQSHEGVRTAQAIINLALLTGNIGRPGTGANSITGQCNAMGSRLFSLTTGLPAGRDFSNAGHRKEVAELLNIDEARIPDHAGWAYPEIVEGIRKGNIKGLWIIATNPAHSWIHQSEFREILGQLEFLVVQDMYATTETAQEADLVLPAAGWGEKDGTFINSERRIGRIRKVARAPGQALSDFAIFKLIAHYWGCPEMFEAWATPADVFEFMKACSKGQPCDFSGIPDMDAVASQGGVQWPCPEGAYPPERERRLFESRKFFRPGGKAKFAFEKPRKMPEEVDQEFPFLLLTGRGSASQWHTQTRTSKSPVLRKLYPQSIYVEINPSDARRLMIQDQQQVKIQSRRGRIVAKAQVTPSVGLGQVFLPMHYAATNQLTHPSFDPYSRQPSYKACAVSVIPLNGWEGEEYHDR